ncbi:MAG: LPS export ABC transporter periplasmic protein LptC [Synergistaceae bacterium]|nr:LPS export ABC transporter periplasmic protein LptC [Synergistaceae bacterium]
MKIKKLLIIFCALSIFCPFSVEAFAAEETRKVTNTMTADDIRYNVNTGDAKASGSVVIKREDSTLWGDEAEGNTEKEIMTLRGNVKGEFPRQHVTLKSESATWTGDKSKKTDGSVEAFGEVLLTRGEKDRLNADYVWWQVGSENYRARGNVDGIMENRILIAAEASRTGETFRASGVRRYEDLTEKFVLSARSVQGRFAKDGKTGNEILQEMVADKDVVFDFVDNEGMKSRVTGDKAVYSKARGTIVVSGNTKAVRSDGKTVTADTMVVHEDTRLIEAKGNSKIVFIVEEKKREEPAAGAADGASAGAGAEKEAADAETETAGEKRPPEPRPTSSISDREKEWVEGD